MSNKIDLIAHSKCGYSLQQIEKIKTKGFEDNINVVYCDIKNKGKNDKRCGEVEGFPTFFNGPTKIHTGYTENLQSLIGQKK